MQVRDAMTPVVLQVGPDHTLRQAAQLMAERNVGSAVVMDVDASGPGILTERDILRSIARGEDPEREPVRDHLTDSATVCAPTTELEDAAAAMMRGGFRHIVVCEGPELVGVLSMRDVVRTWLEERKPAM